MFSQSDLHYRTTSYIQEEIWSKFRLNVTKNLPQAILGVGVGCYSDSDHVKAIQSGLKDELETIAKAKGIDEVVFDRGGFIYQGKIKALADAAREAGLNF